MVARERFELSSAGPELMWLDIRQGCAEILGVL